jgi:hypothetical protein
MIADHDDDEAIERRPVQNEADVAVPRKELRVRQRIWATAAERHGQRWADGLNIQFRHDGRPSLIEHRDGETRELAELRRLLEQED